MAHPGVLAVALVAAAVLPSPADLVEGGALPDGYELVDDVVELGYDEFTDRSPYSLDGVEAGLGTDVRAVQSVAARDDSSILLRELAIWGDAATAAASTQGVLAHATSLGLGSVDTSIDGATAFSGDDDGVWTRMVAWSNDRVSITVSHFSADGDVGDQHLTDAARSIADGVSRAVDASAPNDPLADGGAAGTPGSGGGIPITTVLVALVVIGGAIWAVVAIRRRRRDRDDVGRPTDGAGSVPDDRDDAGGDSDDDERGGDERSVEEMIERARARRRAEREIDAIPDPNDGWTPRDDT